MRPMNEECVGMEDKLKPTGIHMGHLLNIRYRFREEVLLNIIVGSDILRDPPYSNRSL